MSAAQDMARSLYWSVRRELWENRSLYVAPLIVSAVVLFGAVVDAMRLPQRMRALEALDAAQQNSILSKPYDTAAGLVFVAVFLAGVFYCADALYGERRDRSILFWKSLPVSDRTTVLSKASIPLIVMPLFMLALIIALQVVILLISTVVVMANGLSAASMWSQLKYSQKLVALFYTLVAITLWHVPVYGWLLLVSAWARRATLVWAALPLFALAAVERIAVGTARLGALLQYRLIGWFSEAFAFDGRGAPADPLTPLDPAKFFSTPGLWIGLLFGAFCIAAAVRLRRNREPI